MARLYDVSKGRSDKFNIPIELIRVVPGWNCRKDFGDEEEFARDIAENGQRKAVTVRQNGEFIDLIDGERRLRGIKLANEKYGAKIETVVCESEARYANEEDMIVTMLVSNESKPLEPLEKAEAFKRLIAFGWDEEKIAKKMGYSVSSVKIILDLGGAPAEVRKAVKEKKMSPTVASKVAKASPKKRKTIMEKVDKGEKIKVKHVVKKRTQFSLNEIKKAVEKICPAACEFKSEFLKSFETEE